MQGDDRQILRDAIERLRHSDAAFAYTKWELQTSCSFRRIGMRGDGDVLHGSIHPIDNQSDLTAAPKVLKYIVAASPNVVASILADLDKIRQIVEDYYDVNRPRAMSGPMLAETIAAIRQVLSNTEETP